MRSINWCRGVVLSAVLALSASPLRASPPWWDREPPIRWEEMLACRLVVVGRYESHNGKTLHLRILRVLRGMGAAAGEVLAVALRHGYSLETTGTGQTRFLANPPPPDASPKLCYLQGAASWEPPEPIKVVRDVRRPAIYFLRTAQAPALFHRGQVQPIILEDGWKAALAGKPMPLPFRLLQSADPALRRDALDELSESRDPAMLRRLADWVTDPPELCNFARLDFRPADMLIALGDHGGDVYDRVLAGMRTRWDESEADRFWGLREAGRVMVRTDRARSARDFAKLRAEWLSKTPPLPADGPWIAAAVFALCAAAAMTPSWPFRAFAVLVAAVTLLAPTPQPEPRDAGWLSSIENEGLRDLEQEQRSGGRHWQPPDQFRKYTAPLNAERLDWYTDHRRGRLWLKRHPLSPEIVADLKQRIEGAQYHFPIREIEQSIVIDPAQGLPMLESALKSPRLQQDGYGMKLLELGVRYGHPELVDRLLKEMADYIASGRRDLRPPVLAAPCLLHCGHPKAHAEYIRLLDAQRRLFLPEKVSFSGSENDECLSGVYTELLDELFPEHAADYFPRIVSLLESESLSEREAAKESLDKHLHSFFGFDPQALRRMRAEKMKSLRPLLAKLAGLSEMEMRAEVLRQAGLKLEGRPGPGWIAELKAAMGDPDQTRYLNAFLVLEELGAE